MVLIKNNTIVFITDIFTYILRNKSKEYENYLLVTTLIVGATI